MNLKSYSTEASSIVWEDSWSIAKDDTRDPEGSKLVDKLAMELRRQNELKKKNTKFTDPFFLPTASSLFVDPSRKFQDFLEGHYTGNIVWKRPSELFADKEIKVFSGTISPDDLKQGLIGNCCKSRSHSLVLGTRRLQGSILMLWKQGSLHLSPPLLQARTMYWYGAARHYLSPIFLNPLNQVKDLIIEEHADLGLYGVKFFLMGRWVSGGARCTRSNAHAWAAGLGGRWVAGGLIAWRAGRWAGG
jgi:hypothetical protein